MALHAKAKAEAGYRFYALYDKISREEDILAHAWAQCRSNRGAPGVDGRDFADVEAYGVQRWLGELALALKKETYRPDAVRRVFIPKANGKLRPLGISTLRDRVCMAAAMLALEPIFEADLPPEQYAYRLGCNAQQAVIEVQETLFRGYPEVVDADLADYCGSIPHGLDPKSMMDVINVSSGRSAASQEKFMRQVLPRSFDFGFPISSICKDIGLAIDECEALGVPTWVGSQACQVWNFAMKQDGTKRDMTELVNYVEQWSNAVPPKPVPKVE